MQKAAALAYNATKNHAPKVLASGKGLIAQQIIQKAKELDIPLFANSELVDLLVNLELNQEIPAELYEAVASVFVWLYDIERESELSR